MDRTITEKELFDNFIKLGWSRDSQSLSIFNFLMNSSRILKIGSDTQYIFFEI